MPTSRKPRKLPGLAVLALWAAPLIVHAVSLIRLNSGMQMTCQFVNNTGGQYTNSQIYVVAISQNSAGQYCHLDAAGDMVPCVAGENGSAYFLSLSAFPGFQFPTVMTSARLYVSLGSPLNIPINSGTPVGIAYPNISNPTDPNINTSFDWIEYNIGNGQIFCNTTQVDMFGISMLMDLYDNGAGGPTLNGEVGTTESTSALLNEYLSAVPTAFAGLEGPVRIVAPLHGSFGTGGANAGYFDAYINSVWTQYTTSPLIITLNTGTYTGRVGGDGRLAFTTPGDPNTYYVSEPSTNDVWGGAGNLATGNGTELALEAQICAAFHRHVIDNAANLNNVPAYYLTAPTDYYSSFWHQHNVNAKAYGFCYDDVNEQSSSLVSNNPRAIVLSIGGGAALTPTMTPTPVVASTWRVKAGSSQYTDSQGNVWSADENYTGGTAAVTTSAIAGALPGAGDQALYQSQRWGNPFSYVFNVPAGSYQVTLKFAETYWTAAGDRVFNVSINGNTVLTNFDIYKTAGGQNIALDEVFNNIAPSGGAISIQFGPASADNAMVDAIQIIPMPSTSTPTPTVTNTLTCNQNRHTHMDGVLDANFNLDEHSNFFAHTVFYNHSPDDHIHDDGYVDKDGDRLVHEYPRSTHEHTDEHFDIYRDHHFHIDPHPYSRDSRQYPYFNGHIHPDLHRDEFDDRQRNSLPDSNGNINNDRDVHPHGYRYLFVDRHLHGHRDPCGYGNIYLQRSLTPPRIR